MQILIFSVSLVGLLKLVDIYSLLGSSLYNYCPRYFSFEVLGQKKFRTKLVISWEFIICEEKTLEACIHSQNIFDISRLEAYYLNFIANQIISSSVAEVFWVCKSAHWIHKHR